MSENRREVQEPEVIPSGTNQGTSLQPFATNLQAALQSITGRLSLSDFPRNIDYSELKPDEKEVVDAIMERLKPEIEEKAKALLTIETRDRIVKQGDFKALSKILMKGKKSFLKRKKGCIFIQFGTGEADDPIEEFMIAST